MVKLTILQSMSPFLVAGIVFILIIVCYLFGHYLRRKALEKNPEQATVGLGAISGTLLGLLGLLLAFTFSMASSRYDSRRALVIEEVNNISTAVLRTDVYPDSIRQLFRENFKEYVESRIAFYQAGMDIDKTVAYYVKADGLSKKIWSMAAAFARTDNLTTRTSELIPALNAMIDITTTRLSAGISTIPDSIMYFLFVLCFCSAFLLGYENNHKIDWVVVIGFTIMLTATVYTIIDLDRPRSGFITMDIPNQKLIELRGMFIEN